jgi:hypothetical protein
MVRVDSIEQVSVSTFQVPDREPGHTVAPSETVTEMTV